MFDEKVPKVLKDYLNYSSNLNKSSNTLKEYKYDLINFMKYLKLQSLNNKKLTVDDVETIYDIDSKFLNKVDINDLYDYLTYLKDKCNDSAVTRARKIASMRSFFKYIHVKARLIDNNPAKELESPKLRKASSKIFNIGTEHGTFKWSEEH